MKYPDVVRERSRELRKDPAEHTQDAVAELLMQQFELPAPPSVRSIGRWDNPPDPIPARQRGSKLDRIDKRIQEWEQVEARLAHWNRLLEVASELRRVGTLSPDPRELKNWAARPNVLTWPLPGGELYWDIDGNLRVRLIAEGRGEWNQLKQHLPDHPVWDEAVRWKLLTVKDLAARRSLLIRLCGRIRSQLGINVTLAEGQIPAGGKPLIHGYYVNSLYRRLFRRAAGLPVSQMGRDGIWELGRSAEGFQTLTDEHPITLMFEDHPIASGCSMNAKEKIIRLLVDDQLDPDVLTQMETVADTYQQAQEAAAELRETATQLLSESNPPAGSTCNDCNPR